MIQVPERGVYPREFLSLGFREHREIFSNLITSFIELIIIMFIYT